MWKKIKEILCKHTAHKDETSHPSAPGTITTSMINLKPLPSTPSRRTEALNHHRPYRKAASKSTLNKTDEHCRSLFNLLPTSFRPRHQTSHQKGVDASTTTTTQTSPTTDRYTTDYDSGYMSQSVLNRTSSYVSCYSAVASTIPIPSMIRHGSIESLLHGHSKSNPTSVRVLVRRNFEPFAQAHIGVHKGMIVTALFSRGPWLYIRLESNGQTGYIPRIICSLYQTSHRNNEKPYYHPQHHLSVSSTDSSSNKDDELDLTILSTNNDEHFIRPYVKQKQQQQQPPPPPISRYLSHSSAVINDQSKSKDILKKRSIQINHDERERRNTCTLPPPPSASLSSTITSSKDRRLTLSSINWSVPTKTSEPASIHQVTETSTSMNNEGLPPTRDTDSSSTQDSGYSESTPYYLVQQTTPDTEPTATVSTPSKKATASPHYATVRRSSHLKSIDSTTNTYHNSLRRHHPPSSSSQTSTYNRISQHRHTLFNGLSMNDILSNSTSNKRHSFGAFYLNDHDQEDQTTSPPTTTKQSVQTRPIEFALIRNVRRDKDEIYQRAKPTIYNLPKSHRQIPASICLHHHRQQQQQQQQQQQRKQQFGSSHSAFRPVQPTVKSKRASSEGHSPSSDQQIQSPSISSTPSSISSSNSSLNQTKKSHSLKQRRLSCDLPVPVLGHFNSGSLTRSVCEQISMKKLNHVARTMSEILCDQFSELNLDAIEKDSLVQQQQQPLTNKKLEQSLQKVSSTQPGLFTITKDYRSSRASFSVKRGDCVFVLKQVGRACFLVRKQTNGQVGFLPKALMIPTRSTKIDTFLEMHGYRETVI